MKGTITSLTRWFICLYIVYYSEHCLIAYGSIQKSSGKPPNQHLLGLSVQDVRSHVDNLFNAGKSIDLIEFLITLEKVRGSLYYDDSIPSLYMYLGVALYISQRLEEAQRYFKLAISLYPKEIRAWINLGEIQVQTFQLEEAVKSFNHAYESGGDISAVPR